MDKCQRKYKGSNDCPGVFLLHTCNAWKERKTSQLVTRNRRSCLGGGKFTKHITLANRPNTQMIFFLTFTEKVKKCYGDCRDMTKRIERCQKEKRRAGSGWFLTDAF